MKFLRKDRYSPNHVMIIVTVCVCCASLFCAKSLWIPATRIPNLHMRAVVLSITEAVSAFSSSIGCDTLVPRIRSGFLSITGLDSHSSWDSRYFNKRETHHVQKTTLAVMESPIATPLKNSVTLFAETAQLPVEKTKEPVITSVYSRTSPLPVYFFGDSQVFSLASGLSRLVGKGSSIDVEFLAIHSSGFIRDDFYDWPQKLEDTLSEKQYAAVVIMLGMNDYQNFWTQDRRVLKKRTNEWETVYKEKCRNLVDSALSRVTRVYWVQMPLVKNASYNENLKYIEEIHDDVAQEYSPDVLARISLQDTIPGSELPYTDTIETAPGKVLKVMTEDGSHYTVEGGQLVMKRLFNRLVTDFPFSEVPVAILPE